MNAESTREALDVASLAGDILLASGAEIFRVEETIDRIARAYGVNSSDAFVLSSGIFLTAESGKKQEFARVRHIPLSAARLDKVTAVNQLSREIEEGLHAPKEAKAWLLDIQRMPDKPRWHQVLASGVGSACFCFLFGGDVVDSMVAFLSGFVLYVLSAVPAARQNVEDCDEHFRRRTRHADRRLSVPGGNRPSSGQGHHRFDYSAGAGRQLSRTRSVILRIRTTSRVPCGCSMRCS